MATTGAAHLALASDALSTPPELLPQFAERAALLPGTPPPPPPQRGTPRPPPPPLSY